MSISFWGVDRAATPIFWAGCAMLTLPVASLLTSLSSAYWSGLFAPPSWLEEQAVFQLMVGQEGAYFSLALLAPTVIALFTLLRWQWLAAKATLAHAPLPPNVSAWGIVLWNFVPIALYFKPFQNLREIWRSTGHMPAQRRIFQVFWVSSVIDSIFGSISLRQPSDVFTSPGWLVFDGISVLVAVVFWGSARALLRDITDAIVQMEQRHVF